MDSAKSLIVDQTHLVLVRSKLVLDTPPLILTIFFRLRNEITRLTAVKALIRIASSELKINLRPILAESLPILAGFLRKNQRALKLSSLALLDILVSGRIDRISCSWIILANSRRGRR